MKINRAAFYFEREVKFNITESCDELIEKIDFFHEKEISIENYFNLTKKELRTTSSDTYNFPILNSIGRISLKKLSREIECLVDLTRMKIKKSEGNSSDFNEFYDITFLFFRKKLKKKARYSKKLVNLNSVIYSLEEYIINLIIFLSRRSLILAVNTWLNVKGNNKVSGFNHGFSVDVLIDLIDKYPVLFRRMIYEIERTISYVCYIIKKYKSDAKKISAAFYHGRKIDRITGLTLGLGDPHQGKKTVCEIKTKSQKIIFKPRPCYEIDFYKEIINYINRNTSEYQLHMYVPTVIISKNHTWIEKIENEECKNRQEVSFFYRSLGAQMAITHALNGIDFHHENIIAKGPYPVLIDLECLFTNNYVNINNLEGEINSLQKAIIKISESISTSGFLPFSKAGKSDISALTKNIVKCKKNIYTNDNGELILQDNYYYSEYLSHTPKQNKNVENHEKYINEIKIGFCLIYDFICNNKKNFIDFVKLHCTKVRSRVLFKNTSRYYELMKISTHPIFMSNMINCEILFSTLWNDANEVAINNKIPNIEIGDFLRGDIPYFFTPVNTVISNSKMGTFHSNNSISPLKAVIKKIEGMSLQDRDLQVSIIDSLLGEGEVKKLLMNSSHSYNNCNEFIDPIKVLEFITEKLDSAMLFSGNDDICSISIYLSKNGKHYLSPMNNGLYNGIAGIGLLYLSLYKSTQNESYLEKSRGIISSIERYHGYFDQDMTTS